MISQSPLRPRVFLLSPANLAGVRARRVMDAHSESDFACRLRQRGVPLGELFSFISGLYFRGKLAYAKAFAAPPSSISGSFVITANAGLVPPDTPVSLERLQSIASGNVDPSDERYRVPLDRDSRLLSEMTGGECDVVLLGSIATPKYVEPLLGIFGERLLFPGEFVGRGDMSRGGLMLRRVAAGNELAYMPVYHATRRGPRPPKLAPVQVPIAGRNR